MTQQTPKTDAPRLIHHPSAVLDDLCVYDAQNQAWSQFDQQLSEQLHELEEKYRPFWTRQAVRKSLGR